MNPFSRTPIIITFIVSTVVFILSIVYLAAFVPDSGPKIISALTVLLPLMATNIGVLVMQFRTNRTAGETREQSELNSKKLDQHADTLKVITGSIQQIKQNGGQ